MTFRLCLFGNSHLAALRDGWTAHPGRWPGITVSFVGAHRNLLLETEIRDGHLWPASAAAADRFRRLGGVASVDLGAFDGFVIAGAQTGVTAAVMVWRDMRWVGLPSLAACPDLARMAPRLVSAAAARDSVAARLSTRLAPALARRLRSATDRPIWITAQPRPSAAILTAPRPQTLRLAEALRLGDGAGLSALHDAAAQMACAAAGAIYLPQPQDTIQQHLLTALPYVSGATRLAATADQPQPDDDIVHANGAYGRRMLDAVAARIAAAGQPV